MPCRAVIAAYVTPLEQLPTQPSMRFQGTIALLEVHIRPKRDNALYAHCLVSVVLLLSTVTAVLLQKQGRHNWCLQREANTSSNDLNSSMGFPGL